MKKPSENDVLQYLQNEPITLYGYQPLPDDIEIGTPSALIYSISKQVEQLNQFPDDALLDLPLRYCEQLSKD